LKFGGKTLYALLFLVEVLSQIKFFHHVSIIVPELLKILICIHLSLFLLSNNFGTFFNRIFHE